MIDDRKDKERIRRVQDSTYCKCGQPKRYWHTQCEVCMGVNPEVEVPDKLEPKLKEGNNSNQADGWF